MKVRWNTLLLIAALVWSAAGFNILRIGLLACPPYRTIVNYLLSAVVFTVFQIFIFGRLVNKPTARISAYEEELHFFLKFFDVKSFIIMAVMMTGGITDGATADALAALGISIDKTLADNDAYHTLKACGGLIVTGPTGTNVNDITVLLV